MISFKGKKLFSGGYWGRITLCLMLLIFSQGKQLYAVEVSGSLSIPFPAPSGDVDIDIYVEQIDGYSYTARTFTIFAGNTNVDFTLGYGDATTPARVRYVCLTNCGDIYPAGYAGVNATGISYSYEDAKIFTTNTSGINLNLPLGFRVNGEVKLPVPDNAVGDIGVEVTAEQQTNPFYQVTANPDILIHAGESSASYSLLLPPDPSGLWRLSYSIPSKDPATYYHTGYYVDSVTTTYIPENAVNLHGSTPYSNADLILLRGRTIEGSIALPAGRVAPAGGLNITMRTYGWHDQEEITIPEGGTSAGYALVTPYDMNNSYYVMYDSSNTLKEAGYLPQGHYAGPSQPTFFVHRDGYGALNGGESHTGIDLTLIPAKRISGNISLPKPAPSGGLSLIIYADDPMYPGAEADYVDIPAGSKSTPYTVFIPEDSTLNWRVEHYFYNKSGYVQTAYYAVTGTTHRFDEATLLNGGMDHYHIDMNAIPDKDNDGIPDSIDPVDNVMNPGVLLLLGRNTP